MHTPHTCMLLTRARSACTHFTQERSSHVHAPHTCTLLTRARSPHVHASHTCTLLMHTFHTCMLLTHAHSSCTRLTRACSLHVHTPHTCMFLTGAAPREWKQAFCRSITLLLGSVVRRKVLGSVFLRLTNLDSLGTDGKRCDQSLQKVPEPSKIGTSDTPGTVHQEDDVCCCITLTLQWFPHRRS